VAGVQTYRALGLRWTEYPDLAGKLDVQFDTERWTKKTLEYRDALPLSEIELSEAEVKIDLDQLTERNSKRTSTVSIYADLDGFTKLVQEAEDDAAVVSLVRKLNMIRAELHAVVKSDYPGVVLQHQGDRMFAIIHLPAGDKLAKRCQNGLDACIGIQSSMVHVLREKLESASELKVAIGLDVGSALVSRLGKKGEREPICLGPTVCNAENLQLNSSGREIRISRSIYDQIEDDVVKGEFSEEEDDSYVAKGLTFPRIDEKKEADAARSNRLDAVVTGPLIKVGRNEDRLPDAPRANRRPWYRGHLG
jgi:class 3 adenylate cyclase